MRNLPKKPWLYLITNRKACNSRQLADLIEEAAEAGVDLIQIREKDLPAGAICQLVERAVQVAGPYPTRILVNDRFDIALGCGAHGVHLTTESIPPDVVRRQVGGRLMIGVSTHSLEEVKRAEAANADFVVCGPLFETPSKRPFGPPMGLDVFASIVKQANIPVLGLGGIDLTNFDQVLARGASGIAAIRLFIGPQTVKDVVRQVKGHQP